jgi:alpha-amylase/alpha-mannosidase (GH57 family)
LKRSVVIHGHFYQPPRDDPWTGTIPVEANAAPFHDWNERIERECYAPVSPSLASMSFDFGPTLLEWMERHAAATYASVVAAGRSRGGGGGGGAVAMPYHHPILPLSPRRDKLTEVRWGIADFRRRFGREPEGMWLPETAVDDETLDVLAGAGVRFTILAPHQVERVPAGGLPGWYRTSGGRRIAVFTYDGAISHDVAFGPLVRDADAWIERLTAGPNELVAVATDGETYGHHHKGGEVVLARVLETLRRRDDVRVENFASFLARRPPEQEVRLVAPSSWSCPHGVERWRAECGCRAAPERGLHQRWRAPLRAALEWLATELRAPFERERRPLPHELERHALRMFTSCGWFFDDIAGIESVIVLRSELSGAEAPRLEAGLLDRLALAPSNDPAVGSGRELYLKRVKR